MYDNDINYHLNFRQQDFYEAAKQQRLVRLAKQASRKSKSAMPIFTSFLRLTLMALLVYELAVLIYG